MRAAALAFYSALSLAPMIVLLIGLASFFTADASQRFMDGLADLLGERAAQSVDLLLADGSARRVFGATSGWGSLAVLLFGASALFAQLQRSLNRVWNIAPRPGRALRSWVRARLHAIGLIVTLAFLLVVSLTFSALIAVVTPPGAWFWQALEEGLSLTCFVLVFASMFKVLPDAHIGWRAIVLGALLTAALFFVGKLGLQYYLEHARVGGTSGPARSVVVLLVWVYYSAAVVLLGAEITRAVAAARGAPIEPHAHAALRDD